MAEGLTDRGIGERLFITPKTVETHVRHIFAKLDLPSEARPRTGACTLSSRAYAIDRRDAKREAGSRRRR